MASLLEITALLRGMALSMFVHNLHSLILILSAASIQAYL